MSSPLIGSPGRALVKVPVIYSFLKLRFDRATLVSLNRSFLGILNSTWFDRKNSIQVRLNVKRKLLVDVKTRESKGVMIVKREGNRFGNFLRFHSVRNQCVLIQLFDVSPSKRRFISQLSSLYRCRHRDRRCNGHCIEISRGVLANRSIAKLTFLR